MITTTLPLHSAKCWSEQSLQGLALSACVFNRFHNRHSGGHDDGAGLQLGLLGDGAGLVVHQGVRFTSQFLGEAPVHRQENASLPDPIGHVRPCCEMSASRADGSQLTVHDLQIKGIIRVDFQEWFGVHLVEPLHFSRARHRVPLPEVAPDSEHKGVGIAGGSASPSGCSLQKRALPLRVGKW